MNILYIDPGSSSLFVQFLIAIVVGIGLFFKNIKLFVLSFFVRKRKTDEPQNEMPKEENDKP